MYYAIEIRPASIENFIVYTGANQIHPKEDVCVMCMLA
jgi:hypothetical protein